MNQIKFNLTYLLNELHDVLYVYKVSRIWVYTFNPIIVRVLTGLAYLFKYLNMTHNMNCYHFLQQQ